MSSVTTVTLAQLQTRTDEVAAASGLKYNNGPDETAFLMQIICDEVAYCQLDTVMDTVRADEILRKATNQFMRNSNAV